MAERILTQRELNRALLARQLLLERSRLPITRALEQVGGLQTQYAPSGYIGLWTRLENFTRADLTRALERRAVVQASLMRVTIHLVSARDFPLLSAGVRHARRRWWLKTQRGRVDPRQVEVGARRLRQLLADGPRRREELIRELRIDSATWSGLGLWIDLVRAPPSGTWRQRRANLFATADKWLPAADPLPEEGIRHLIRRYLCGFGPARTMDIADWAGLPISTVASGLEELEVVRFSDEAGGQLVDLPGAPLPEAHTPAPVRFLPVWDATLLVHARRTGVLPEPYRARIFNTRTPQSVGTFLVDGTVAGTWKYERGRIVAEPFKRLTAESQRELEEERRRLEAFHAD